MEGNSQLAEIALGKLAKLKLSPGSSRTYLEQLVNQFLDSENALARLREKYPDQWEAATGSKVRKERKLVLEYPPGSTNSAADVTTIVRSLKEELARQVPALDDSFIDAMSWGSIADWLMRCPLDFEFSESAS
jgi:DNA polymerase II small subunit/DNA polymerase delta subunit B